MQERKSVLERRFKISDCLKLLHVDGKTFHRWLEKTDIDLNQQRNRADTRKKWLTGEQIVQLGREHDHEVQFPDEMLQEQEETRADDTAPATATLYEILASLRQLEQRIDQLDGRLAALPNELRQVATTAPLQTPSLPPIPTAGIVTTHPSTSTPPPKPTLKTTNQRKRKTTTKSKKLPAILTPLSTFRQIHGISEKAVENAIQRNKLAVVRGKWRSNNRAIAIALDQSAQQQFYMLFHEREGFTRCDQCPHAVAAS